jgi:hypothetical protein
VSLRGRRALPECPELEHFERRILLIEQEEILMRRFVLAAFAAAGVLVFVPAAQAKAPPDGIDVCGAANACTHVDAKDAERMPGLFIGGSNTFRMPAAPAPFYVLRWQWGPDQPVQTTYYVPGAERIRRGPEPAMAAVTWWTLDAFSAAGLKAAVQGLEPAPTPTITKVTVGGLTARDPQSYVRLWHVGRQVWSRPSTAWLQVQLQSAEPSPWTDAAEDIRIARTGGYLWLDGWVFKIPVRLAALARSGRSLD